MAAKTPIIIVSSSRNSAKYVRTERRPSASAASASFQEASSTTGISTAAIRISTSAMPSTPTA